MIRRRALAAFLSATQFATMQLEAASAGRIKENRKRIAASLG